VKNSFERTAFVDSCHHPPLIIITDFPPVSQRNSYGLLLRILKRILFLSTFISPINCLNYLCALGWYSYSSCCWDTGTPWTYYTFIQFCVTFYYSFRPCSKNRTSSLITFAGYLLSDALNRGASLKVTIEYRYSYCSAFKSHNSTFWPIAVINTLCPEFRFILFRVYHTYFSIQVLCNQKMWNLRIISIRFCA
jgi:hypothetical protein